jgi:hypothetical protein
MKSESALVVLASGVLLYGLVLSAQALKPTESTLQQSQSSGSDSQVNQEKAERENQARHVVDGPLRRERAARVDQARREVKHREADLLKAEAKGKAGKIEQGKVKLADARKELEDAQADLTR